MDPTKVEAIMEWFVLTNVLEVCSFMGLAILSMVLRVFLKYGKSDHGIAEEKP